MQAAGAYLRLFREARGLERGEVAVALGTHKNTIGQWELGKNIPNIEVFIGWCEVLHVPVDQAIALIRSKTATPLEGIRMAVKYLVKCEGLDDDDIARLSYWRTFYGDAKIREALGPEFD